MAFVLYGRKPFLFYEEGWNLIDILLDILDFILALIEAFYGSRKNKKSR